MNRRLLAALLAPLCLLTVPVATAAPFLQAGYDAARTGASPDPGPASDDIAFQVRLPGPRSDEAPPLVLGGAAYVLTTDYDLGGLDETGLWRIDLSTAEVTKHVAFDDGVRPDGLASDGERFFITRDWGLDAYAVTTGERVWSWDHDTLLAGPHDRTRCQEPAVRAGVVYVACTERGPGRTVAGGTLNFVSSQGVYPAARFAAALEASTGQERWFAAIDEPGGAAVLERSTQAAPTRTAANPWTFGISVVGQRVLVVGTDGEFGEAGEITVWAFEASTGTFLWARTDTQAVAEDRADRSVRYVTGQGPSPASVGFSPALPTGRPGTIYEKLSPDVRVITEDGEEVRSHTFDPGSGDLAEISHLALTGDGLYAVTGRSLYRADPATLTEAWRFDLPTGEHWSHGGLLVANGTVYSRIQISSTLQGVQAIDVQDGTPLWRRVVEQSAGADPHFWLLFGLGDGAFVTATLDGGVTVIGDVPASLQPSAEVDTLYPRPGEQVTANLAATGDGAFGPATEFRADWGDGTVTDWQASPSLSHAYGAPVDRTARFQVRNEANQTASRFITFHVGTPEPVAPNLIETAFARENQDLTFGVLGVGVALAGGLIAVGRRRTRRGRLQQELAAVDKAVELAGDEPAPKEAALRERRAHAKGLLVDGSLDEAQYVVLERHLDELAQNARVGRLEEEFDFLPLGMARALEGMLSDGRVSRWEAERFLEGLEGEDRLDNEEKAKVRSLVETWFAADRGVDT